MVKAFGWSLHDIGETPIEMLLPFIRRLMKEGQPTADSGPPMQQPKTKQVYIDQVMHWFG